MSYTQPVGFGNAPLPDNKEEFGDLGDPNSEVSKLVEAREGFALMPEQGTAPVNRYLPPRPKADAAPETAPRMLEHEDTSDDGAGLLAVGIPAP